MRNWKRRNLLNPPAGEPILYKNLNEYKTGKNGDSIQEPEILFRKLPTYTELARKLRISGSIVLGIDISKEGIPSVRDIIKPIGLDLDEQAIEAVSKWRFKPAYLEGKPIPYMAVVEVTFKIY